MFGRNNKLDTGWLSSVGVFDGFNDAQLAQIADLGERVDVEAVTDGDQRQPVGHAHPALIQLTQHDGVRILVRMQNQRCNAGGQQI